MIDELASGSAPKLIGQEVRGLHALCYGSEAIVIRKGYAHTYNSHPSRGSVKCLSNRFPLVPKRLHMKFPDFSFSCWVTSLSSLKLA